MEPQGLKTQALELGVNAVWIPQSEECEFLVALWDGAVLGHIHKRNKLWNGFWFRRTARLMIETEVEMKLALKFAARESHPAGGRPD